jgi:exosortase
MMQPSDLVLESTAGGTGEASRSRPGKAGMVCGLMVLAVCWGFVFNGLRVDWATNPQYGYGWFVPLLALGLFRLRWNTRPAAAPAQAGREPAVLAACALAALLPIRLIEEANPEWRLIQWAHALEMVLVTFWCVYYAGGRPWVRHFAFPVCFLLVAVPWPVPLEQAFVQNLMRVVAGLTVEAVGFLNIPAVQHGNIIQISSGLVGVDEACSGIRSLQTAFFICLFLGELYRFAPARRLWLLLLGFGVALACNVARTFFLVWSAARQGLDRMHAQHDAAGRLVLVITLACIWGVAWWLKRSRPPAPVRPAGEATGRIPPGRVVVGAMIWILAVEAATEAWYRAHESKALENAHWSIVWPDAQSNAVPVPIDPSVQATLRCNEGRAEVWQDAAGCQWQAFFFRWGPGRNSAQLAGAHTPDICLRGVGYELTHDLGPQLVPVDGLQLPFHQYVFSRGHLPLHVFYCRWEDRLAMQQPEDLREDGTKTSRLRAVLAGRRHLGQRVFEVAISGPGNSDEALAALRSQLPRMIRK